MVRILHLVPPRWGFREGFMPFGLSSRPLIAFCALLAVLALAVVDADARSRGSFGSRGSKTFTAPPTTQTAPNQARPVERTMAQPSQPATPATPGAAARPNAAAPAGGLLNRPGLFGSFAAGFLGAGLIGLLLGHGLTGGLGGLASIVGLLLQIGLVVAVGYMLWSWWQRRNQPAFAGAPSLRDAVPSRPMGLGGVAGLGGAASPPFAPTASDFEQFEKLLGDIQTAYGAEDLSRLRQCVTPEVLSYYAEELAANTSRGVLNRISDVKLLQGDLSEAWREGNADYATVAMRYSLNDQIVDRASGRVIEGGPGEATEVWTFMRTRGGAWLLSAVQQV
jgi:predicted lipid-binding transport protein (Tim44 family)